MADGTAPAAPAGAHTTIPPVAERRLVSVLFADLVGFTTIAEGRDAEAVRDLLSRYFDLCQEIIGRYGGTVEKFIGDAVMAVWGAPVAHENDAERAVRAALDLVTTVGQLGPAVQARAGVLTGEAAVTLGATNQGMVAGDLVNTASRLQSVAPPGVVLVGEATMRAADSAIAFEEAGNQVLKGKSAPVAAYRAVRVVAERGGRGRSGRLEAPFTGRDDEFRLLRDLVHATTRERRPRLVSITGQAGVGKSRMTSELSKYIDGVVEDVFWHTGRSPAYGEGITFWALGEMVRARAGLAETDDEATTRARIAATVTEWIPDDAERRWVERALLTLLGVEGHTGGARDELFSAWRTFFERIAARGTVLLIFEDLHWADAGLLDFIDHVLDWTKSAPIMIVTLARPDLIEWRPGWGSGRRNFVGVALEPLPSDAMHALLAGLVPGLPDRAADLIVGRADGIPLYAVETVRMLVTDGKLLDDEGTYRPAGDLSDLAIPETLHALVAARLDALEVTERSLVQDAAVLGQSFTPDGLAAVSGLGVDIVTQRLRSLVRREILAHEADPRSPERGQYAFVQALVREVAYGTLARRDRRTRHLAAARFFEGLGEEELAGALASHYLAAYRASADDPEAHALAAQARLALKGAAERAASLGSNDQAAAYFLEAIEVTEDASGIAELYERAGVVADDGGRSELAEEHLRAAVEKYRELGDRAGEARASGLMGRAIVNGWRATQAIEPLEAAARQFSDMSDDPSLAMIEHQLARAYWFIDDRARGIEFVDRALGRAERLGNVGLVSDALITKGALIAQSGRPYEGLGAMQAGIDLAEASGLTAVTVRGQLNVSATLMDRDLRAALDVARQTMVIARRFGLRSSLATAMGNANEIAVRLGEWDRSLGDTDLVLDDLQVNDRRALCRGLVEIHAARGEPVDALLEEQSSALGGDSQDESNYHGSLGMVAFMRGDDRTAAAEWERSAVTNPLNALTDLPRAARAVLWGHGDLAEAKRLVALMDEIGAVTAPTQVAKDAIVATIDALEGDRDAALARFEAVLATARDLGFLLDEMFVAGDMVVALGPGDPVVAAALSRGREIATDLRAEALLARLDALVGAASAALPSSAVDGSAVR